MEASKPDYYGRHDTRPRSAEAQSFLKDASRRVEKYCITAVSSRPSRRACRIRTTPSVDGSFTVTYIIPIGAFDVESQVRPYGLTQPPVGLAVE